jgi:transcriptional regulator with XRE-family HTH domain
MPDKTIHEGRNVKRIREMLGIKQEALASELGDDWSQRKISLLEDKETIEPKVLEQVAKALKVPAEAIKNFDENAAINMFAETINNHDQAASVFYNSTINPIDKWMEALEENKKLYELLIQTEREKTALLEKMLEAKK